jgi:hypothetical protein
LNHQHQAQLAAAQKVEEELETELATARQEVEALRRLLKDDQITKLKLTVEGQSKEVTVLPKLKVHTK